MTSNIQPSTPPLGSTTGFEDNQSDAFFESTLLLEDQDNVSNILKNHQNEQQSKEGNGLFDFDQDTTDNNAFTIETNNSGGIDFDSNIFNDEEFNNLSSVFATEKSKEDLIPKSPILTEVPSNANFFNLKSSQEYTIEEDQPFMDETFKMHQEKLEKEEKPSDVAPFSDASEHSFLAGTSNLNDKMDMKPPTRLKFSAEGSYSSSATTDPQTSMSAPSISIMEADDNPFSLTSPQDFSSNVSSNESVSGFSNNNVSSRSSSTSSPPSKSVKTENKSSASQKLFDRDDLSGYNSDVSGEGEQNDEKIPYFEVRITLSQYNFFRIVRLPQHVDLNQTYIIAMEALDWEDNKYIEHPHYFRDETGRIFACLSRKKTNIPPGEEANAKDETNYRINQVLKHERSVLLLYYTSDKKDWTISIALQEIFDSRPKDSYTQEIYCTSGRGGSISELNSSKEGKFDKAAVNKHLEVKYKSLKSKSIK